MNQKLINNFEFLSCILILSISSFLGVGQYCLLETSKTDSFLTLLLSLIVGIPLIFILTKILNYKKELNLKEKIEVLFKSKISKIIIILIISLSFLLICTSIEYDINEFIMSQFLSLTPSIIIGILFTLLICYVNKKGIEVIVRLANILLFFILFLILIAIIGEFFSPKLDNLKPIFVTNYKEIIKGIIYVTIMNIIPIFTILCIPKKSIVNNKNTNKYIYLTFIISFIILTIILLYTIGNLGIDLSRLYEYPTYMTLKRLKLLSFLNRIENIIIMQWVFETFISISLMVHLISQLTKINTTIISFIILILSNILFSNNTIFKQIVFNYSPYLCIIILLVFIIIFVKTKKEAYASK